MRQLATIQLIADIQPIPDADAIEKVKVRVDRRTITYCTCGSAKARNHTLRCRKCFHDSIRVPHTRQEYVREWRLYKLYGMEAGEFEAWWVVCRGLCFICERPMRWPAARRGQAMDVVAVDHDHKTGKVRGLLCNACNKGIGHFRDDVNIMGKAISYLGGRAQ